MKPTDIRITIQPIDEYGVGVGDHNEVTYPIPEDTIELEDLMGYIRGDIQEAIEDYLIIL